MFAQLLENLQLKFSLSHFIFKIWVEKQEESSSWGKESSNGSDYVRCFLWFIGLFVAALRA